MMQADRS